MYNDNKQLIHWNNVNEVCSKSIESDLVFTKKKKKKKEYVNRRPFNSKKYTKQPKFVSVQNQEEGHFRNREANYSEC